MSPPIGTRQGAPANIEGLPWPEGDSGQLAESANHLAGAAEQLRGVAGRLSFATLAAATWQGTASASFRAAVTDEGDAMQWGAAALENAAAPLRKLSVLVEDAQQQVRQLAEEVREAEEQARIAAQQAVVAQALALTAGAAVAVAVEPSPALRANARAAEDQADLAGAAAANAQTGADAVRERAMQRAQQLCDDVLREDRATAELVQAAAASAPLGGTAAGLVSPAQRYVQESFSGLTPEQWQQLALWRAGVDPSQWDPSAGLLANDQIVQNIYSYYGETFMEHPELQWMGLAGMAGSMFYGLWQDLYTFRQVSDEDDRLEYLSEDLLNLPDLPDFVYDGARVLDGLQPGEFLEHLTSNEVEWFEDQFLSMQQQIFNDMAWKHEAYVFGGIETMRELEAEGAITFTELRTWEHIASGDPDRMFQGAEDLVWREQNLIIQDDYDAMRRHHGLVGEAFTQLATWTADSPVPGGEPYRDVVTRELVFEVPNVEPGIPFGPSLEIYDTPDYHQTLPRGNVADFDDRWEWIVEDMLPAYRELLEEPGGMQEVLSTSVAERAEDARKLGFLPYPGG